MAKPHIVLLPGAWHSPEAYAPLTSELQSHGYTVHARKLPAVGNPDPPKDLSQDIAATQSLVEEAISDGNDVIVVPHSWAGIVAGSALSGYGKKEREAAGKKGGVVRTGYIAAFIVDEGVGLLDALGENLPSWFRFEEPYVIVTESPFYTDIPEAEQKKWHDQLETHALGTWRAGATAASWKHIPTSYLLCEDDLALPAMAQEAMCKHVEDQGAEIDVTRIKSSHSPFLSKLHETAQWLRKVAGEEIE